MPWVREGYCCRCGDCCRGPVEGVIPAQADGACPFLMAVNAKGERLCEIHDRPNDGTPQTYWSRGCNVWPTDPMHIADLPRCTYTFRWED